MSIELGILTAFGGIAWSGEGKFGVTFDQLLTERQLDRLEREVRVAALRWRSVDERLAARDWHSNVAR